MKSLVDNIKLIVPNQPDAESLQAFLAQAQKYSNDSEFETDIGSARAFTELLSQVYSSNEKLIKSSPNIERQIKAIMMKLGWLNPHTLDSKQKEEYIAKNLVSSIKQNWDPMSAITRWLDYYEPGTPDANRRSEVLALMGQNEERIGMEMITLKTGESVASTVKNWIRDYVSSLPDSQTDTGTLGKVQYLTNNPNAKKLNEADKKTLSQVIDIYRLLKYPNEAALREKSSAGIEIPAPTKPTAPAATPAPASKQQSNFDAKLAAVSAPVSSHGQDLSSLRKKLEENKVSLAPKAQSAAVKMTPAEIKREVNTPELPTHMQPAVKPAPAPEPVLRPAPKVEKPRPAIKRNYGPMAIRSLNDIHVLEDLKKVEPGHLRQGPVNAQLQIIKTKIITLAKADNVLPYYAVSAFEQSPLFLTYLDKGSAQVSGDADSADLSQEEFEAMADLRKEIERL